MSFANNYLLIGLKGDDFMPGIMIGVLIIGYTAFIIYKKAKDVKEGKSCCSGCSGCSSKNKCGLR
jgi:hypothetical protein